MSLAIQHLKLKVVMKVLFWLYSTKKCQITLLNTFSYFDWKIEERWKSFWDFSINAKQIEWSIEFILPQSFCFYFLVSRCFLKAMLVKQRKRSVKPYLCSQLQDFFWISRQLLGPRYSGSFLSGSHSFSLKLSLKNH